jgi:DNA-binding NtrC family response regulator
LNVFHISLPPLRDRKEDIPSIAAGMIRDLNRKHGCRVTHLNQEVLDWFAAESWPGNVRELRNQVERAVIMAGEGEIQIRHLPNAAAAQKTVSSPAVPAREAVAAAAVPDNTLQVKVGVKMSEVEENYIRLTLKHTKNNKKRAAELLGLCLRTLHNKLRTYEDSNKVRSAAASESSFERELLPR